MGDAFKKTLDGMTAEDAANLLRTLASLLEENVAAGPVSPFLPLDLELGDVAKLKLSLKREDDGFAVKMKIRLPDAPPRPSPLDYLDVPPRHEESLPPAGAAETESVTDGERESYRSLKKRMKKSFGAIRESLRSGDAPTRDLVDAFLADSRRMTGFRGYGDEHYEAYDRAVDRFRDAWDAADMPACQTAVQDLDRLKKTCHERYK